MATPTYASSRLQLPDTAYTVSTIAGTTTSTKNWNVYLSSENRVGLNKLSNPKAIAVNVGEGLEITITADAIATAEDPYWLVVSIEDTGNESDAVQVASFKVKEDNQTVQRALPVTIQLTTDEHFITDRTVLDTPSLPTTGMVDGAIALITPDIYYRYDSEAFINSGQLYSYGTPVDGIGSWIRHRRTFSTYVPDTKTITNGVSGADRDLKTIEYALTIPPKEENQLTSTPLRYWLNNGFVNDAGSPIINGCFTFKVLIDGVDYSGVFDEYIKYTLLGYCDRNDSILNTSISTAGTLKTWSSTSKIKLPEDLPRNYAAVLEVYFEYDAAELNSKLPETYNFLELTLVEVGINTGQTSEIANLFGDSVFKDRNRLLIVPGLFRLAGLGTVEVPDAVGWVIDQPGEQPLVGLVADTADQVAAMSGAVNGFVTIRQQNDTLASSEVIRAYISTETGTSDLSVVSNAITLSNEGLTITVTHPINGNGKGIIRADYPDIYLQGVELGNFTPSKIQLFFDFDGSFYQSGVESVVAATTQIFTVSSLAELTAIGSFPVQSDNAFSLFEISDIAIASAAGTITATAVTVWAAYVYESPNTVATKIRHDLNDAIPTQTLSLGKIAADAGLFSDHLNNTTGNPHQLDPARIGAATQADMTTALADIATNVANIASNLALINANTTAINNLPVVEAYSVADIAARDALTNVTEGSICKVADSDGQGTPANYFYNDGAWEQYADLTGTTNNTYSVADIAARDAIANPVENDIAKVADSDGQGTPADYVYDGTQWLAFIGAASGGANNVYSVADIAARDALTGVIENDIAKVADSDGQGTPADYVYDGTQWLPFETAVQTGLEIVALLEALTSTDKLNGSAIENLGDIGNDTPASNYALLYDPATQGYKPGFVNTGIGAGSILLPNFEDAFIDVDNTLLTAHVLNTGSGNWEDAKRLTTASSPDSQIITNELTIATADTGIVYDAGATNLVVRLLWEVVTGVNNGAIAFRYESDGNMCLVNLTEADIKIQTVVADVVTDIATAVFTFTDGQSYIIEAQVVGFKVKVLIDNAVVLSDVVITAFEDQTRFGWLRLGAFANIAYFSGMSLAASTAEGGGGSGGATEAPTTITGLLLWLDASDASTLTLSGSDVTGWNDKSGNDNHVTGVAGTPTYANGEITLSSAEGFSLAAPTFNLNAERTIFILFQVANNSKTNLIFRAGNNTGNELFVIDIRTDTSQARVITWNSTLSAVATFDSNNYQIVEVSYNGSNVACYIDQTLIFDTPATVLTNPANATEIGYASYTNTAGSFEGKIKEVLIYDSALSASDRATVYSHLA